MSAPVTSLTGGPVNRMTARGDGPLRRAGLIGRSDHREGLVPDQARRAGGVRVRVPAAGA